MSRLATSFVLGYHGCDKDIGLRAVNGETALIHSDQEFDWLGPGTYFWESDPRRALEWAQSKAARGACRQPYVIGAVIDLGNCLDFASREDLELVRAAHESFADLRRQSGLPMPHNKNLKSDPNEDLLLRYLDCAVIRHLHGMMKAQRMKPFDTVRGMFTEGERLYDGSGFYRKSHVQIAVCTASSIKGLFIPRPYPRLAATPT